MPPEGFPSIQMLKASGAALSTVNARKSHPAVFVIGAKTVTLAHGATAYFGLALSHQIGYDNLTCRTSAALKITAPGSAKAFVL